MTRHWVVMYACLAVTAIGCSDEGKGEEENVFDQYEEKADSFSQPTEHGELIFGIEQDLELTGDHLYHAWDFTLTDQATVTVETVLVTSNLDTVLYLYRFNPETERYGRYIARNDDADSNTVASRIIRDLEPGEYRVLVKGFKEAFLGRLQLLAICEGAGCSGAGDCDPANFRGMPEASPNSCGEVLSAALLGTTRDTGSSSVTLEEACALPDAAQYGVELYYDYWDGIGGWEDMFGYYGDEIYVDVDWFTMSNGSWYVSADAGGDEAGMDFLINASGELVAYYQHNQSPDYTIFCDGEQTYGDEECGWIYLDSMPHPEGDEQNGTEEGVTDTDATSRLDAVAYLAYQEYKRELSLQADDPVTVTYSTWEQQEAYGNWDMAGRVSVSAEGQLAHHYEIADESNTQWLFTVKRGDDTERMYECREL